MQEVWEKKRKKGKIIIIINKKLTGKINMRKKEEQIKKNKKNNTHACPIFFRNHFLLGNNFGVFKVFIIRVRLLLFYLELFHVTYN